MRINSSYMKIAMGFTLAISAVPITSPVYSKAINFPDVQDSSYYADAVQELAERGILKGYEDGTFKPNNIATRGQMAKILTGILGLDTKNVVDPKFTDVLPSNPYYGAIAALAQAGIISGYEDRTFRMNEPIQRNHLAKMLVKAFQLQSPEGAEIPFTDVREEYKSYILALYANGITTGRTATQFDGESYVTRGQLAAFVVRAEKALQLAVKEEEISIPDVTPSDEPRPNLTFNVSLKDITGIFSTDKEYAVVTSAVIGKLYLEGDIVKITFVSEEAIPKEAFKAKVNNIEYDFNFNKNENTWILTKFKESYSKGSSSKKKIAVTGISLNKTTVTINQGETTQLTASILPTNATNKQLTWTSSNPAVATVDETGKVTAIDGGTATITATTVDGLKTAMAVVEVVIPVTGIMLNEMSGDLVIGDTTTLMATVTPTNATNQQITWTSSNLAVATVDTAGVVYAVAPGSATITATTEDGQHRATYIAHVLPKVSILGVSKVGETLTANVTTPATATARVSYQWQESIEKKGTSPYLYTNIANATGDTLQVTSAQAGKYIRVVVTVTDSYSKSVISEVTNRVSSDELAVISIPYDWRELYDTYEYEYEPSNYKVSYFSSSMTRYGFVLGDYIYWPFDDRGNSGQLIVVAYDIQGEVVKTFDLSGHGYRYVENIISDPVNEEITFTVQSNTFTLDWSFFEVNN